MYLQGLEGVSQIDVSTGVGESGTITVSTMEGGCGTNSVKQWHKIGESEIAVSTREGGSTMSTRELIWVTNSCVHNGGRVG